jgi:hypothetical protein
MGLHPLRSEWRLLSKGRSFPFLPPFPTHTFPALYTPTCFSHPLPPRSRNLDRTMFCIKADPRSLPCYTSPLIIAQLSPLYTPSLTIISTTRRYTNTRSSLNALYDTDSQQQTFGYIKQRIVQPQNYPSFRFQHWKVENNAVSINIVDNTAPQLLNDYCI